LDKSEKEKEKISRECLGIWNGWFIGR